MKEGEQVEILRYAFTGVNLIPTALLLLILFYWLTVILGALDLDFIDFDLDGVEEAGPFYALLAFLNVAELPIMLLLSMWILNFWIIAMFLYYLPLTIGGLLHSFLLVAAFSLSIIITRYESMPLKGLFRTSHAGDIRGNAVLKQFCRVNCDISNSRLGQAELEGDGASIIINVKSENKSDTFKKGELAFVYRKDTTKEIYYILKVEE